MSNFNQAIKWMKEGEKVRRKCWSPQFTKYLIKGYGCYNNSDGGIFSISPDDTDAIDWELFNEHYPEISFKDLSDWIKTARIQGVSPNTLIISHPGNPIIKIGNTDVFVDAHPLIHSVMGIEIWVDKSIPKGKGYLIDKNLIIELNEKEDKNG